ncbi:retrovirus-related pol polyprotein from transposon TNT 1-94, partial [Tanacetum coccineum]
IRELNVKYLEIQDLKAQLQDKNITISELKKLIATLTGKSMETKFEKSSVIHQPNAFKSQRQLILRKPATFSDSLTKKEFSKPVTAQILPQNVKQVFKNTKVIAPKMYKLDTRKTQTRTTQLPQDFKKTNKRVSFSTGVIATTSVSRPQLKSNQLEDRVVPNNSEVKTKEVEEHRRNFKFSKNKMFVTTCNDSLNVKTSNVNFVCVTYGKCVLNDNHDLCVLHYINSVNNRSKQPITVPISANKPKRIVNQSVATSLKKTVASESTNKIPRKLIRKLHEHASKTSNWWYSKISPPGYQWKPKSSAMNAKPNVSMPLGKKSRNANILESNTLRGSILSKSPLSSNSFAAHRDNTVHRRLWVLKAQDGKSQAPKSLLHHSSKHIYSNLICLMAKASSSQAWLWHSGLSFLNFDTINLLSKNDIVNGLPKLKFVKDHLCSSCELGKAKCKSFKTKTTPSSKRRLQILHMDLCGPMRVESFNGKKYVLVIVDEYSRFTWTHFLRSKDETPQVLIDFLKLVQRGLYALVRTVRTNKGT